MVLQEQASSQNPLLSAEDQKFRGGNSIFLDKHNKEKKKSIFEFFINYEKTSLQIFFYFVRMFFGS